MAPYAKHKTRNETHKMNTFSLLHAAHSRHILMFSSFLTAEIYRFCTDICPILTQITRSIILTIKTILFARNVYKDFYFILFLFIFLPRCFSKFVEQWLSQTWLTYKTPASSICFCIQRTDWLNLLSSILLCLSSGVGTELEKKIKRNRIVHPYYSQTSHWAVF